MTETKRDGMVRILNDFVVQLKHEEESKGIEMSSSAV